MSKKAVLGRGFDGLIPTGMDIASVATPGEHIKQLPLDAILVNPDQPRKHFDENALQELAASIKEHGIIQPLVVTPKGDSYRIVAGERRFRASQIAGLTKVPAIVRNHKELEELEIALVENVQRVDLSPLEQAVSIVRLRDQFSLTPKQIAQKLGKAETTVSNIVRLLQLPPEAVEALQKNDITEGHARAILALKTDEKLQKELLNTIITQKLSVRDAEDFVKQHRAQKTSTKASYSPAIQKIFNRLDASLLPKARVKETREGKGALLLQYDSETELEQLIARLNSK
jgi:ParB family chromosome partitioning protein